LSFRHDTAQLPRSARSGPLVVGRTSKSKIAVGKYNEQHTSSTKQQQRSRRMPSSIATRGNKNQRNRSAERTPATEVRPTRVRKERYSMFASGLDQIRVVRYAWRHAGHGIAWAYQEKTEAAPRLNRIVYRTVELDSDAT